MKRKFSLFFSVSLCSILLFSACTKEEKNSNDGELTYTIKPANLTASIGATASESGLLVDINTNSNLTWKAGYISISELNFEAKKDDRKIEYKLTESSTIDLFKLSQEFGSINIPAGAYNEIELEMVLDKQTTGYVFAVSGIYKDGLGQQTPVEFNYNEGVTFKLGAENLTVNSSTDYTGLLTLQLNKLLSNLSFSDFIFAVKNANGTIVISSNSNVELYHKMKAGFMTSAKAEVKN